MTKQYTEIQVLIRIYFVFDPWMDILIPGSRKFLIVESRIREIFAREIWNPGLW